MIFPYHISHHSHHVQTTIVKANEINKNTKPKKKTIESAIKFESDDNTSTIKKNLEPEKKGSVQENEDNILSNINLSGPVGSNNCIISGKHTASGFPILCNDPHLLTEIPAFWYIAYTEVKDEGFKILGASHAGNPCHLTGQNGYLMWGITNGLSDTANIIRLKKVDNESYLLDGKTAKLSVRKEKYCTSQTECENVDFYYIKGVGNVLNGYTQYIYMLYDQGKLGNEFFDEKNYFYVFRSHLVDEDCTLSKVLSTFQFHKSVKSFRENVSLADIPMNLVFADQEGNIYYQHAGKIPIHYDDEGNVISNNSQEILKHKHLGYCEIINTSSQLHAENIPFEDLPFIKNPDRGYIVSANNLVVPDNYQYFMPGFYYPNYRALSIELAIEKMIKESNSKITPQMVDEKILQNVYDPWALEHIELINKILVTSLTKEGNESEKTRILNNEHYKLMLTHDGLNTFKSVPALIFNVL